MEHIIHKKIPVTKLLFLKFLVESRKVVNGEEGLSPPPSCTGKKAGGESGADIKFFFYQVDTLASIATDPLIQF